MLSEYYWMLGKSTLCFRKRHTKYVWVRCQSDHRSINRPAGEASCNKQLLPFYGHSSATPKAIPIPETPFPVFNQSPVYLKPFLSYFIPRLDACCALHLMY